MRAAPRPFSGKGTVNRMQHAGTDDRPPFDRLPPQPVYPRGSRLVAAIGILLCSLLLGLPWARGAAPAQAAGEIDVSNRDGVTAGKLLDGTMHSATLSMDLPYRIYLPPNYGTSGTRYPTLFMLHGGGGSYLEWTEKSHLAAAADAMISQGRMAPMIIVMPEGDTSWYVNWDNQGPRWADHIVYDLVSFVDFSYRTIPDREYRAIGGLSMGGHGALQLAMNHPETFSIAGGHSPSLFQMQGGSEPSFFGSWDSYAVNDPLRLAQTRDSVRSLQIWLDVGDQDGWKYGVEQLHAALAARGVEHQWHEYPGLHLNSYWEDHSGDYLKFYSDAFSGTIPRQPTATPLPTVTVTPTAAPTATATPNPTATAEPAPTEIPEETVQTEEDDAATEAVDEDAAVVPEAGSGSTWTDLE